MAAESTSFALLRQPGTRIALVGASAAPHKYGHIILEDLRRKGYTVLPVNARSQESIDGLRVVAHLRDIPSPPPDIVNIVTPPESTAEVLREAAALGLPRVWLQEGSFDRETLVLARSLGFAEVVSDSCIMVISARYR